MRTLAIGSLCAAALYAGVAACGVSADEASAAGDGYNGAGGGSTTTTTGTGEGGGGPPPEQELESLYSAPVATGNYVWIANPESGRVAFIDAVSLTIELVEAGHAPTHLAAVPDAEDDVAIVLNVLSLDATVLRASANGAFSATGLAVPSGGNRWAVSSDGRWATAWTDARAIDAPDPIDGYQDITVLDLTGSTASGLTVGYRPVELAYDSSSSRLFAVTQDGVTVVALDGGEPVVINNVALSDDPIDDSSTRDVAITPDGAFALVRRDGESAVSVFSLTNGSRTDVSLSGSVTDLDLSPDGTVAVAVVRETSQVALLPVPGIVTNPQGFNSFTVTAAAVGSVALATDSPVGFLYTNATPNPVLTTFDSSLGAPEPSSILLHAPVQAVFPAADASHAVVLHGALEDTSSYPAAVSLVPVGAQLPSKIVGLEQPLASLAIAPQGDRVLIAGGDEDSTDYSMLVAKLPSLEVEVHPLASLPIAAGIVAGANRGYVAQEHPDGRITFIDFTDGGVRTLTGFELATKVVDGSEP